MSQFQTYSLWILASRKKGMALSLSHMSTGTGQVFKRCSLCCWSLEIEKVELSVTEDHKEAES